MRMVLTGLLAVVLVWSVGLAMFVRNIPQPVAPTQNADAIAVLTGGSLRVQQGLQALSEGKAQALFISGVGKDTTLDALLKENLDEAARTKITKNKRVIVLDHKAKSTRQNAREVAIFLRSHCFKTVRLITANYHMQRSVLELKHTMPEATIIADAVSPPAFRLHRWWRDDTTRTLMLTEFHKYWWAKLRDIARKIPHVA